MLQRQSPAGGGTTGLKWVLGGTAGGMAPWVRKACLLVCVSPKAEYRCPCTRCHKSVPFFCLGPSELPRGLMEGKGAEPMWPSGSKGGSRATEVKVDVFLIFSVKTRNPWGKQAAPAAELGGCAPCWSPRSWGGSRRRPWRPWGTPGPSHGKWRAGSGEGWGWYGLLQTSHPVQACQVKFSLDSFAKTS